jgi:hypothetical protein
MKSLCRNLCGCGSCGLCQTFVMQARRRATNRKSWKRTYRPRKRRCRSVLDRTTQTAVLKSTERGKLISAIAAHRGLSPEAIYNWCARHVKEWPLRSSR